MSSGSFGQVDQAAIALAPSESALIVGNAYLRSSSPAKRTAMILNGLSSNCCKQCRLACWGSASFLAL